MIAPPVSRFLSLSIIAGLLASHDAAGAEIIRLRPGFQAVIDNVADVTRISVGNPDIVEARPLTRKDGILVVGRKEGETDLVVWGNGQRTGWTVRVKDTKPSPADEIRSLAARYPEVTVSENGSSVIVSGVVPSAGDKVLFEEFAKTRTGILLRLSLPEDKMTLLSYEMRIIEISKGAATHLGIRWPDSLSVRGTWAASGDAGTSFALASDFEARLNILMADGRAKILANPKLVCESGKSASFVAGGEIPIVIITPETRTVEWKTYGIILKLQPKMDHGNRIRTLITAEISTIDHGSGSSDVPGFLTRRVETHFSTPPGETIMLSGLVKSETAKDVAKVPLLGQIPILGELFKSRSFRENQSELAIFITPTEVKTGSEGDAASWSAKTAKEEKALRFRIID